MLKGKVALITGGNTGIGKEIARTFAENGADVAIVSIQINNEDELKAELGAFGVKCKCYQANVTDFKKAGEAVKQIAADFGHIDILVNNAGITKDGLLVRMSESDFDAVISVNLKGAFNYTRQVAPLMFKQKSGRIISISSVVGISGNLGQANYSASKAGIIGLTKSASKELGLRGITVNAIAPGFIQTGMTGVLDEKVQEKMLERVTIKRMGLPADIANTALFLASDKASYITGQVICVDGGISL